MNAKYIRRFVPNPFIIPCFQFKLIIAAGYIGVSDIPAAFGVHPIGINAFQLMMMAVFETFFYCLNEAIGVSVF